MVHRVMAAEELWTAGCAPLRIPVAVADNQTSAVPWRAYQSHVRTRVSAAAQPLMAAEIWARVVAAGAAPLDRAVVVAGNHTLAEAGVRARRRLVHNWVTPAASGVMGVEDSSTARAELAARLGRPAVAAANRAYVVLRHANHRHVRSKVITAASGVMVAAGLSTARAELAARPDRPVAEAASLVYAALAHVYPRLVRTRVSTAVRRVMAAEC